MNVKNASAVICGLGGLGSNIAVMLARSGIGRLRLIDFDRVEQSNLNRQTYCPKHIGMFKADALSEQLSEIAPHTATEAVRLRVTAENAVSLTEGFDVVCEAFDSPEAKAMLTETLLMKLPEVKLVCGSGMAGIGSANSITTRRISDNLYVCGDGGGGSEFYAPRVMICAGHQANMVLRLLDGMDEP